MSKPPPDPFTQFLQGMDQIEHATFDPFFGPHAPPQHPGPAQPPNNASRFLDPANHHLYSIPTWLLFLKTEGPAHDPHLRSLADHIHLSVHQGQVVTAVDDPSVLRQAVALRNDPHLAQQLGANYQRDHRNIYPITVYAGQNARPDPTVAQDQQALLTLGFNIGMQRPSGIRDPLTDASLREFAALAHPAPTAANLHATLQAAAHNAQVASQRSGNPTAITPEIAFSIDNASRATHNNFNYMMNVAAQESHFDPTIRPTERTRHGTVLGDAQGLYQMKSQTWLAELQRYGAKYGLGQLASQITGGTTDEHTIADPRALNYALSLRTNPRYNALFGGELQNEDRAQLPAADRNDPGKLYAFHFFGNPAIGSFINDIGRHPDAPAAASVSADTVHSNRDLFYRDGVALTNQQLYARMTGIATARDYDRLRPDVAPSGTLNARNAPNHPHKTSPA
jgi:hypothetical protein